MKRIINFLTIIVIIVSCFLVSSRFILRLKAPVTLPDSVENKPFNAFSDFPPEKQKFVDIEVDKYTFSNFTQREQKDQVLDWLLYTTVYSSGMTAEALSESLFDLPPIRYGYMHPVANFEFVDTRSCVIGDSSIIALVPWDIQDDRYKDYLAGIADKHRKDLGKEPKIIHLFRYKIDLKERYALLKRCRDVKAGVLFTEEYGYYTSMAHDLDSFKKFMEKIEDITYVEMVGASLKLGGRKLRGPYRGIRVEDVAAIWQAETEIQYLPKKIIKKWRAKRRLLIEMLDEYYLRQSNVYPLPPPDRFNKIITLDEIMDKALGVSHSLQDDTQGYKLPDRITSPNHYEQEYKKLQKMMLEDLKKTRIPDSAGFSLDPTYDFKGLQKYFSNTGRLFKAFSSFGLKLIEKEEIQKIVDELRDDNIVPLLVILDKLKRCDNDKAQFLGVLYEALVQRHRFQKARYDGPLQGTEVGMVLFYTDLLAKLWALDYMDSTPGKYIKDFIPLTQTKISPVFKQESIELPSTRLWFGPNDKGFQKIGEGNQLLFARNAARVYAASSNPLQPGKEVAPNAESAAFLGWWNDHYEEIARYEQEYQRLNEIMKWSILIAWLNNVDKGYYLYFLQNVKVYKGNWFTEWVKSQPNLKFKKWDKVKLYNKGYLGTDTEAMSILYSRKYERFGQHWTLSGGVSLARKNLFKDHPPLSTKISEPMRRSGLDYDKTTIEDDHKILLTLEGKSFNLQNITPTKSSVIATPKEGEKLRDLSGEIRPEEIEQTFSSKTEVLEIETEIGDNQLGQLKVSNSKNGFKIGWESRDIDAGHSLARKLSKAENPVDVLLKEPNIASIIQEDEDQFFIKFKDSETWLKMVPEEEPHILIADGYQSRVSDIDGGIKNYQLKWIEPSALESELSFENSEYIIIKCFKNTGKEMIVVNPIRGPPPTASKPFEIDYGYFTLKGHIDPKRVEIFIERSSIPNHLRETPDNLQRVLKKDLPIILEKAKRLGGMIKHKGTNSLDTDAVVTYLRNKDYGKAAKEIVQNPRQFKSSFSDHLRDELLRNKEFHEAGLYSKAEDHIEDLIEIYGPRPELKIREGIILLKRHRYKEAKNQFQQLLPESNETERERVLKEINSLLKNSTLKFGFNKEKNRIELECSLDKNIQGQIVTETEFDNINKDKPPTIYIQDDPTLTNLDWWPATRTGNFTQAIRSRRVFKLLETDLDRVKPDILHVPGELANRHIGNPPPPPPSNPGNNPSSPYRFISHSNYRFILLYDDDDDDEEEEKERRGEIYIIFTEA